MQIKKINWKDQLSWLFGIQTSWMEMELHVVKKYWKVEAEDCSEYFFDAVEENTTAATELAAPPTLPEVIDTEVVGTNDGGVNDLLNALNRVMELMMTISLHQKTCHPQLMEQLVDCPF